MIYKKAFIIITSCLLVTLYSCGQKTNSNDKNIKLIDSSFTIENLEIVVYKIALPHIDSFDSFSEKTIEIKADRKKPLFLQFQTGGTETNITIRDSVYANNFKKRLDCPPSKQLNFGHNESGLIDISDLKAGTYFIQYSSCNFIGSYKLILIN